MPPAYSKISSRSGVPSGELVGARADHVAAHSEDGGAGALLHADRLEPLGAVGDDVRDVGHRLHVVHHGRPSPQTGDRRERRALAGLPLAALEGLQEPGLLTADVSACAPMEVDVEVHAAAEHVPAEVAGRVGLGDGGAQSLERPPVLGPHVHVGDVDGVRPGRDQQPLDELVRVELQDLPVLERGGLALVGVAGDVARSAAVLGEKAPLHTGQEPGAAATAKPRVLHHLDDRLGLHLAERLLGGRIAAVGPVVRDPRPVLPGGRQEKPQLGHQDFSWLDVRASWRNRATRPSMSPGDSPSS